MMGKMTSALKPVADRYNIMAEDDRYNFRRQVRSYIKWYGYISQVCRMFDAEMQKEYVFLLFYVIKNELRGPWKGCVTRIREQILEVRKESNIQDARVEVENKANKLLYLIMKWPNVFTIGMGKVAIEVFDRL